MAIKELINVFPFNYSVAKDTVFYAGMVLARGTDGLVVKANRATRVFHNSSVVRRPEGTQGRDHPATCRAT